MMNGNEIRARLADTWPADLVEALCTEVEARQPRTEQQLDTIATDVVDAYAHDHGGHLSCRERALLQDLFGAGGR